MKRGIVPPSEVITLPMHKDYQLSCEPAPMRLRGLSFRIAAPESGHPDDREKVADAQFQVFRRIRGDRDPVPAPVDPV